MSQGHPYCLALEWLGHGRLLWEGMLQGLHRGRMVQSREGRALVTTRGQRFQRKKCSDEGRKMGQRH